VRVRDVTLRDGLQNLAGFVPTARKILMYRAIVAAGVSELQITSFVNPARVPQMADAENIWGSLRGDATRKSILVANPRGVERAVACACVELEAVISASEAYNRKNARKSVDESLLDIAAMARVARASGIKLTVAIANAWHCMTDGATPSERVVELIGTLHAAGVREISLADTTGYAPPDRIFELSSAARSAYPDVIFGAHLHDTKGRGLANAVAALEAGIDWFDASFGGLGGSPFTPGVGGNLSIVTLVDALDAMGIATGIDLGRLVAAGETIGADLADQ
jgi:hydroxymethylglutaryl-CoA lyase